MKKIKYFGIIILTFVALSLNVSTYDGNDNANKFMLEANAVMEIDPGGCAMNGYKTWAGGIGGNKGKDCWCNTIRRPQTECNY